MNYRVMLDLETLGIRPGSSIIAIGASAFDPASVSSALVVGSKFFRVITASSCRQAGLEEDEATIAWWGDQTAEARKTLIASRSSCEGVFPLAGALTAFADWLLDDVCDGVREDVRDVEVWGNGSDFDNALLAEAYVRAGWGAPPWNPYKNRCYRTLKNLVPDLKMGRTGTHHNALDDAISQARHAATLLKLLKVES